MIDLVFMNGHLYKEFHDWYQLHKVEANFDIRRFWVEHFNVWLKDYELAKFMADYFLWVTRDNLSDRLVRIEREIETLQGEYEDSAY